MIQSLVMCPAFNLQFFQRITSAVRRLPLECQDVAYPRLDAPFRLAHARQAIRDTLTNLTTPPDQVAVLGYSTGGYLAVQAASALPMPPAAFILVASPASWALRRTEPGFNETIRALSTRHGLDAEALEKEITEMPPDQEADAVAARLQIPTLLIRGEQDKHVSKAHAERFQAALGDKAHLAEIPGDHYLKGCEVRIASEVRRFLTKL